MSEYRGGLWEFTYRLQGIVANPNHTLDTERLKVLRAAYGLTDEQRYLFNKYWEKAIGDQPPGTDKFSYAVLSSVHQAICDLMYGV